VIPIWGAAACGIGGFVVASAYWRRRLRAVEQSRETSAAWDREFGGDAENKPTMDAEQLSTLSRAAAAADVPPEELPEQIESRSDKIRNLQSQIESMRDGWVETHWEALAEDAALDSPHVVAVDLLGGVHDDARAFAIHALETEGEVVLAVGRDDGTFAVGVHSSMVDQFDVRADDIADAIASEAGGGAGGMESLATGGADDPETLAAAVDEYNSTLRARLPAESTVTSTAGSGNQPEGG